MSQNKKEIDLNRLQKISKEILKEAAGCGATQAEVSIESTTGFSVNAEGGEVETIEYHQDKIVDITVYFGKRRGAASISDLSSKAIREAVFAASHIAKFTDEDPAAGLAEKEELAFDYADIDLGSSWGITVDEAIELAYQCEREALSYDKRLISAEDARVVTSDSVYVYANSEGFVGGFDAHEQEIVCVLVAKDGDGMQRDFSYSTASHASELMSVSTIAKQAAERTIKRLGSRQIKTTKAPVIFYREEARGLIGHFAAAIQGSNLYRKTSFLIDCLGQPIFPAFIQIKEQPHLARAVGSTPFDDEGVRTRSNVFIENGVLNSYALSSYSARKLGMKTTGNAGGPHNLTIKPGNRDLNTLIKSMHKGFLITELMGNGANLVTGDYSRGASGYWVENGEIQFPVSEVTVAGNLRDIYARLVEVGNDVDVRGNVRTGSLLIEEMTIAGS